MKINFSNEECKNSALRKVKECKGAATLFMLALLSIALLFFCLFLEYVAITATYEKCIQELERAANINLEYYMNDDWRQYHLSEVTETALLKSAVLDMAKDRLELSATGEHIEDGKVRYRVYYTLTEVVGSNVPEVRLKGEIHIYPRLLAAYTGPAKIAFAVTTRNVRGD